jgi:hypothetical protein
VRTTTPRKATPTLGEKHIEGLTVAMIVAPGVYARNRMFDLLSTPAGKRARTRAGVVRGIVPQLARATNVSITSESRGGEQVFVLRYGILAVRMSRVVELSAAELAALRIAADRAKVHTLPPGLGDREVVARALARLMEIAGEVAVPPLDGLAIPPGE